jgi:UDP-N-acetylmuramate--alanine ligase
VREINDISKVYFIGIGGIGMSALARYFKSRGCMVSGYDKTETALSRQLEQEGIGVHYSDDISKVPLDTQLVVFTPAVPSSLQELTFCREKGWPVLKRSEILEIISKNSFNICVGGTHGKTTITSMIAHVLRDSGYGCNAFLGGIAVNYNTNFWSSERNVCVIEADEYDRSFLKLSPDVAIISAMDADHLDIYGTEASLQEAFIAFSGRIKEGGLLINKYGLKRGRELKATRHLTYSLQNDMADIYAGGLRIQNGTYVFNVMMKDSMLENIQLNMGGMHNVENALAAIGVAHSLGIEGPKIRSAIAGFRGVKRRFEYIIAPRPAGSPRPGIIQIDDYAHHPEELKALITGAKSLFPGRRCTVIFQPHLFTRTRDLADGFAASLDLADSVILLPIYPAREQPIPGVSSEMILDKMKLNEKRILERKELIVYFREQFLPELNPEFGELVITAGAGDIDALVQPLRQVLESAA